MDYYQIIAERFQETIESIAMSVDQLAGPIAQSSELISQVLLQDGKIFCCGNGPDAALSQLFCHCLLNGLQQERPALPAFNLSADSAVLSGTYGSEDRAQLYARQIHALGRENDLLMLIDSGPGTPDLPIALTAARERGMLTVALISNENKSLASALNAGDPCIQVEANSRSKQIELQTMALQSLYQLIELSLFGDFNQDR
ncbi:MAG: SIS domain-containing protein [Halioglobus sp.]